jgi:sucrose-6-phosphate hydrolase SacC (GH32 family)
MNRYIFLCSIIFIKTWFTAIAGDVLPNERLVQFHGSPDLKTWSHRSDFGDVSGIWECHDLLQVPVNDQPGKSSFPQCGAQ